MATCTLILDRRIKLKNDLFNLSIRVINGKQQVYLNLSKMTEKQYSDIFEKKSIGTKSIEFRHQCQEHVTRVENILLSMKIFDRKILKERFLNPNYVQISSKEEPISLKLSDLFSRYIEENIHLSFRTKKHMEHSRNVFMRDNPEISVIDINKVFLIRNERIRSKEGTSISSINSNFRDLRTVINYYHNRKKILPKDYVYPFSRDGYQIIEYIPKKLVLSNEEIKKVIHFTDFEKDEEFSRDVWELLYRCNGINFADLLRLRWDQKRGNCFVFFRKKTENTRKYMKQEVVVPINEKVQLLLDKVGNQESEFVLGILQEGYSEENFDYFNRKMRKSINKSLNSISEKLNLTIPLKLKTARDTYASVLKRRGVSIEKISEMLSHSSSKTTKHYLSSMDLETAFDVNANLI